MQAKDISPVRSTFPRLRLDLTTPAGRAMAALLAEFADNAQRAIVQCQSDEVAMWPWNAPEPSSAPPIRNSSYRKQKLRYLTGMLRDAHP